LSVSELPGRSDHNGRARGGAGWAAESRQLGLSLRGLGKLGQDDQAAGDGRSLAGRAQPDCAALLAVRLAQADGRGQLRTRALLALLNVHISYYGDASAALGQVRTAGRAQVKNLPAIADRAPHSIAVAAATALASQAGRGARAIYDGGLISPGLIIRADYHGFILPGAFIMLGLI
jgi:hypothetical protein